MNIPPAREDCASVIRRILESRSIPPLPPECSNDHSFSVYHDLLVIRGILEQFARGNFDNDIMIRGAVAGYLKTLQANLRHLTWQVQQVAQGDFSQRVDFMGDFSTAFNSMVVQLDHSLTELKERELRLLKMTDELQAEVRQRRIAEKELRQSEERWNLAVESSRDGIWDINLDTKEEWYSPRFMEMFQFTPSDIPENLRWGSRIHPDDTQQLSYLHKLYEGEVPLEGFCLEFRVKNHGGDYVWVQVRGMPAEAENNTRRLVGVVSDITLQKEKEASLAFRAMHDNLTGLPNRYLLGDRLTQHVAKATRTGGSFIFVTLDLDNFKGVNDTWGHAAGDLLLIELGRRITQCLRHSDTVARLGGDEFVFVYTCDPGKEIQTTRLVMDRLFALLQKPVDLGVTLYTMSFSAGASFFPKHTTEISKLFERADEALYHAKEKGKNTYAIWGEE